MKKKENKNKNLTIGIITLFFVIGIVLLLTSIYFNMNMRMNHMDERNFRDDLISMHHSDGDCQKQNLEKKDNDEMMMHHKMMDEGNFNTNHNFENNNIPKSPGQDAFGAIAEIVTILNNDKNTDWNKVNITALREHLIDMDLIIKDSNVIETKTKYGLIMNITSKNKRSIGAIHRMVKTHSDMILSKIWTSDVELTENGAILKVEDKNDYIKIQHLGFYGLMAYGGNHHQKHHMELGKGEILFQ